MKRLLLIVCGIVLLSSSADAQQRFRRTSFPLNSFVVNPAVAGTEPYAVAGMSYRNQWAGFEGGPTTMLVSGHSSVAKTLGAGLLIYKDDMGGAVSQTGFELTGSYQFKLLNSDVVSFGLCLQGTQFGFDSRNLNVWDADDPALSGGIETSFGVDASTGILVYGIDYSFGLSINNLFQDELGFAAVDTGYNKSIRHYRVMGSYEYEIDRDLSIESSGMIRLTEVTPVQVDLYARAIYTHSRYKAQFWGGLGWRLKDALSMSAGMFYMNTEISYTYDFTTNAYLLGRSSHEVNIAYFIPTRMNGYKGYKRVLQRSRLVK
jgi:type IX secretion system PorP/SprF family membrane protein